MAKENYPEIVMPQCREVRILKGQKALVTGGNSGIGKAVAVALGKAGADVVVNYVREFKRRGVVPEISCADSGKIRLAVESHGNGYDEVVSPNLFFRG